MATEEVVEDKEEEAPTQQTRVASELDIAIWREFKEDNYESECFYRLS